MGHEWGRMGRAEDPGRRDVDREVLVVQGRDRVGQAQQDLVDRQISKQFNSRYV